MTERAARRLVLALLARINTGELTLVEGTHRHVLGAGVPRATVEVRDRAFWRALLHGSRGLAEAYAEDLWDSPDLAAVIRVGARNADSLDAARRTIAPLRGPWQRAHGLVARNTPARSRRQVAAHYDLGNRLYERMLDPTLSYSCAVFERPDATLATTSWRSARAGADSRSMRQRRAAAASRRRRCRASSARRRSRASAPRASSDA